MGIIESERERAGSVCDTVGPCDYKSEIAAATRSLIRADRIFADADAVKVKVKKRNRVQRL
jgi:hypothetical protein